MQPSVRPPFLLRKLLRKLTWIIPQKEKIIYLTFDDGPIPEVTPFVLDLLTKYKAKATFFCVGNNVRKNPEVYTNVKEAGHSIGNHTYNHTNGFKTSVELYLDDVAEAEKFIQTGLFRPPHGRIKLKALRNLRLRFKIIMWDALSGDYSALFTGEQVAANVINNTRPGSIIVFHDSLKAFDRLKIALPKVLEHFTIQGYRFEAITPDLLQYARK